MFGIGMTELIIILVVALLVIGPDKLPDLARTLGKGMSEFKRATEDFRNTMHADMRAEEEKNKLLQKAQTQNKKSAESAETMKTIDENGNIDKSDKSDITNDPIADQAPSSVLDPEDKSANQAPSSVLDPEYKPADQN